MTGGSRSDATLTMTYEYGLFERPEVQWRRGLESATRRCRAWGYNQAEFFDRGTQTCISTDTNGNCTDWRVTITAQCIGRASDDSQRDRDRRDPRAAPSQEGNSRKSARPTASAYSLGTGWPISEGFVVTNDHVIEGRQYIWLVHVDGIRLSATVATRDSKNDSALLRVSDPSKLPPAIPRPLHTREWGREYSRSDTLTQRSWAFSQR